MASFPLVHLLTLFNITTSETRGLMQGAPPPAPPQILIIYSFWHGLSRTINDHVYDISTSNVITSFHLFLCLKLHVICIQYKITKQKTLQILWNYLNRSYYKIQKDKLQVKIGMLCYGKALLDYVNPYRKCWFQRLKFPPTFHGPPLFSSALKGFSFKGAFSGLTILLSPSSWLQI
jgi:hypothetical protein